LGLLAASLPYLGADGKVLHPQGGQRVKLPFGAPNVVDNNMTVNGKERMPKFFAKLDGIKKDVDKSMLSLEGLRQMYADRPGVAVKYGCAHPVRDATAHQVHVDLVILLLTELSATPAPQQTEEAKREMWWQVIHHIDRFEAFRYKECIPWDALGGRVHEGMFALLVARLTLLFDTAGKTKEARDRAPGGQDITHDAAVVFVHNRLKGVGVLGPESVTHRWAASYKRQHDGGRDAGVGGTRGSPNGTPGGGNAKPRTAT
jgi:hypothetical protein